MSATRCQSGRVRELEGDFDLVKQGISALDLEKEEPGHVTCNQRIGQYRPNSNTKKPNLHYKRYQERCFLCLVSVSTALGHGIAGAYADTGGAISVPYIA
eukprot:1894959-Rhodomonas_salina.1